VFRNAQEVTKREFTSPFEDLTLRLEGLLALNLHEFIADVEDITDQAIKEAKMEAILVKLKETWGEQGSVKWVVEPYKVGCFNLSHPPFTCTGSGMPSCVATTHQPSCCTFDDVIVACRCVSTSCC
jgi:hypothetical protein